MKKIVLSISALAVMSYAQEVELKNVEVEASLGTSVNKKDLTDSITVITAEQIKAARINTLAEALNRLGNIAMTSSGGPGKLSAVYLRGMDTQRTLVLIDGVRYNNPTNSGAAAEFSQIMLSNVKQIEIVKGSQSGVWGADASAGVINIVTQSAQKGLHGEANIEYGSYDTKIASLQASYGTDDYDVIMGGSYFNSDGFSAAEPSKVSSDYGLRTDDLGLEKDKYINATFNSKVGYNISDKDRLEASLELIKSQSDYDNGGGSDSAIPTQALDNQFYKLQYRHDGEINDINLVSSYSKFNRVTTGVDYFTSLPYDTVYDGSVTEVRLDDKFTYIEDSFLRFGASYQAFEQKEVITDVDKSYNNLAAFLSNYNKMNIFSDLNTIVTESVRYDKYSDFDNALTAKIGLKQFAYEDYFFSFNVGSGYNVPTIGQLYGLYSPNPDLEAETTISSEITIGSDLFSITGFYNEVDNLITYGFPMYTNEKGTSIIKGVELGYEDYYYDTVGVKINYTYLDARKAGGELLLRRPKDQVDASVVYYATETFDVALNAQYIGSRTDSHFNADYTTSEVQTGYYTLANFVANVEVNDFITVYGKLDNITNVYYQSVDGYATAGRSLYMGLNAKY